MFSRISPFRVFPVLLVVVILIFSMLHPSVIAHASGFTVTKFTDTADGTCDNDCSLREAIIAANAAAGDDTITVPAGIYTLTIVGADEDAAATGDLDINSNITINGAGGSIIDGGAMDRVFHITGPYTVNISGVTVRNGFGNSGGGILNASGTLTITNSTFTGNTLSGVGNSGGGIFQNVGMLTITNSTFSDNVASGGSGGGIYANSGTVAIANTTFSGNNAFVGGGIFEGYSTLTITNSTFSGNSANDYYSYGGGIYHYSGGGVVTLRNTIVANSTSGGNCNGTITDGGNNLDSGNTCGFTINAKINTDPSLGALTGSPAYFPLNSGSLAINAGDDGYCAAAPVNNTSQNGVARPHDTHCEIGSYEYVDITAPIVTTILRVNSNPTNLASVNFTVTFSESVAGVITAAPFNDFALTTSLGITGAFVSGVTPISESTYTVSVDTGSGNGTIRLDVMDNNSIVDGASNPLGGAAVGDGIFTTGEVYTVIKSATFTDVSLSYWANSYIERLYNAGITGGCSLAPLNYCPDSTVTRAQMAVFLLKGIHSSSYIPPAIGTSTGFSDVPVGYWAAAWIKQLAAEGITGGCGTGIYCPDATVTRAQMAVFLLKGKHGTSYAPPAATGVFTDVPMGYWARSWIEQLALEGITGGCGVGVYCPDSSVTRAQMAVFLVKTFSLP